MSALAAGERPLWWSEWEDAEPVATREEKEGLWSLEHAARIARGTVIRHPAVRHPIVTCLFRGPGERLAIRWVLRSREGIICLCSVATDWQWLCQLRATDAGRWKETPLGEVRVERYKEKLGVTADGLYGREEVKTRPPTAWYAPDHVSRHPDLHYALSGDGRGTYRYLAHNVETGEKVLLRAKEVKSAYRHTVGRVFALGETYDAGSVVISTVLPLHT